MTTTRTAQLTAAVAHLQRDPVLAPIIAQVGLCTIEPHAEYYRGLVRAIIGQQLSVAAAAAVMEKFTALFPAAFPTPQQILASDTDTLRGAGLSGAKVKYVQDLALHIVKGSLQIEQLPELGNTEIIRELTAVKGIGEWTAHMFLIFNLGRLDVLAVGDLGIRNGIKNLYQLSELPDAERITKIAAKNHWHPYESVACWYLWQSLKFPATDMLLN
jgi:DNA-3-methyladenine glycosylase II